ncbi:hypothetical protein [Streptomyces sp. NBC_01439]|uniref:hypothetical protein n=1 Tax=Streptomyces sp. NBC_01439 TaxID=2903867 RepID=UPI002E2A48E9|nr:hypothetical protein [Streptomyces sp. NBC_01439]
MTAAGLLARHVAPAAPSEVATDAVALWASAQVTALGVEDSPDYGSPAWSALHATDPHRAVAIITAAEQWRRHTTREAWLDRLLDEDPERWFAYVTADANDYARSIVGDLARRPTQAELSARRAVRIQPRAVAATAGWPPIAIPGRTGWVRTLTRYGRQLDRPRLHQEPSLDPARHPRLPNGGCIDTAA